MITKKARSDGDRRTALFGRTVLAVDRGKWDEALAAMDQQYAIAEQTKDAAAMAGDLQTKGQILLEMAKDDDARAAFDQSLKVTEGSSLSDDIKKNTRLFAHFNNARIALGRNDLAGARTELQAFRSGAETSRNPALHPSGARTGRHRGVAGEKAGRGDFGVRTGGQPEPLQPLSPLSGVSGEG